MDGMIRIQIEDFRFKIFLILLVLCFGRFVDRQCFAAKKGPRNNTKMCS
jgi:hypothetical protein